MAIIKRVKATALARNETDHTSRLSVKRKLLPQLISPPSETIWLYQHIEVCTAYIKVTTQHIDTSTQYKEKCTQYIRNVTTACIPVATGYNAVWTAYIEYCTQQIVHQYL